MSEPKEYEYAVGYGDHGSWVPSDKRRNELRVLRAVEWAEANGVIVDTDKDTGLSDATNRYASGPKVKGGYADAIEALRAKVEPREPTKATRIARDVGVPLPDAEQQARNLHENTQGLMQKYLDTPEACVAFDAETKRIEEAQAEDAATLAALRECRELGAAIMQAPSGRWTVQRANVTGAGDTAQEATDAYKEAQRPKMKDGWYLCRHPMFECLVGARWEGGTLEPPPGLEYSAPELFERVHGPFECPPPPEES